MADTSSDEHFVRRCLAGEKDAFAALVQRYQKRIVNLAYHMIASADDAEDVAQDAFIAAYQSLHRLRRPEHFRIYLFRTANNAALARKRRPRPLPIEPNDAPDPSALDPSTTLSTALLQQAIARLPKRLRAVLVLRELHGLSYPEVAQVLDLNLNTVRSRLHAARLQLRRMLARRLGLERR